MALPKEYKWLDELQAPRMIVEFKKIFGIKEVPGAASNSAILGWAKNLGLEKIYTNDGTAWCGLAMAQICDQAAKPIVSSPLWALSWRYWGIAVVKGGEMLGDVLVFERRNAKGELIGGHVGLYIGETKSHFAVGGGNESDMVTIVFISKTRLVACRRPVYVNQPAEVKKVYLTATGVISTNEV